MKKGQATLNGFLDQGCTIEGDVIFSDLLRVHGQVSGKVSSEQELLVGEGGVVEGEIAVGRLVVADFFIRDIFTSGQLIYYCPL